MNAAHVAPLNLDHAAFERSVEEELVRRGFIIPPALTYHAHWSDDVRRAIAAINSPTALYIRTRADRIAFCPRTGLVFEWEIKTCTRYRDLACEAYPFAHHLAKSELGVRCLYVFRNLLTKREYGIWIEPGCVPIREVRFPGVKSLPLTGLLRRYFPGVHFLETGGTDGGSNDPFLVIDAAAAARLPDWREILLM